MFRIRLWMFLLVVGLAASCHAAETTFAIGDFGFGDWSGSSEVIDDPFVATPGPGTSAAFLLDSGIQGNPGSFRFIDKTNRRGDILIVTDLYSAAAYTLPGSGLGSITFSWDAFTESSASDANTPFIPFIVQDGVNYYSLAGVQYVFVGTGWQPLAWDPQTASDFDTNRFAVFGLAPPDGQQPDFSPAGSPIQFGYATIGQVLGQSTLVVQNGVDNFAATFTPNAVQVPEPASLPMVSMILCSSLLRRRRHVSSL